MDHFNSSDFDDHVRGLLNVWHVPGLAIAVTANGKVCSKAYGYASAESQKPCTPESIFDIASCSKSLTAASVGILVEDKDKYPDVEWKTPVSKILPDDFVMAEDEYTRGITVEDILSHRSGLPRHDESYLGQSAKQPDTAASITRNLRNLAITAPIRSKFQYCNMMYTVATHLIETQTKKTFAEFLSANFFQPLGMNSTHVHPSAAKAAGLSDRLTSPHVYDADSKIYKTIPWNEDPEAQGAGSICTSVNDLIKYIHALLHKTAPFTSDFVSDLLQPRMLIDSSPEDLDPFTSFAAYALGWDVRYYRGYQVVDHSGGIAGFSCICFLVPSQNFGGVILGNSGTAWRVAEILMKELIDAVLDVPPSERVDWAERSRKDKDDGKEKHEKDNAELRKELMKEGQQEPEPFTTKLDLYAGSYHNAGYHTMVVEVRDGRLVIDAADRSVALILSFEHVHSQRVFVVSLVERDDPEEVELLKGEFEFEADGQGQARRLGLKIEPAMDELVWFDRVEG